MRALISVYDKTGVAEFARGLAELGFEIVSSGGTAVTLVEAGLAVTTVEDVTGFPELLDGRVKTLHPRIHAGVLARRGREEDLSALAEHGIEPFDLVCVNLYPFELAVDRPELDEAELIEMIDVGGPALLRAAAKNFASVTVVVRARDYDAVLEELRASGETTPELRRRLAAIAFARSAGYEAAIARWFQRDSDFPETFVPSFDRVRELPYGENPHQRAAYYAERGARTHLLGFVVQHQGKELSYNNLGDLSAARLLAGGARPSGVRHREACEPVRGRGRRHDRGGVREGSRCGSGVGVRGRRRRQPRGDRGAWPTSSRRSSSRSCSHPRTTPLRSIASPARRRCASSSTPSSARPTRPSATIAG